MLTARQEKYVQGLVSGKTQRQAYIAAYPTSSKWKENTIDSRASELLKKSEVLGRYQELRKKAEDEAILTAAQAWRLSPALAILTAVERKRWLTEVIKGEKISTSDKLKALDLLNKMDGQYIDKLEVKQVDTDWFIEDEKTES